MRAERTSALIVALVAAVLVMIVVLMACSASSQPGGSGGTSGVGSTGGASRAAASASKADADAAARLASASENEPVTASSSLGGSASASDDSANDASDVASDDAQAAAGDGAGQAGAGSSDDAGAALSPAAPLVAEALGDGYAYDDLCADVAALAQAYPQWVTLDSLGQTADGRKLHHLVIGNAQAANKVLVHGGIHAREYFTTQLIMKQAAVFLAHAAAGDDYQGTPYASMLEESAIHLVPSVNPDGWVLSQQGADALARDEIRSRVAEIAAMDGASPDASYFSQWKANANGVDLNRNFDALWSDYAGSDHPSSERYKGSAPASEPEARALVSLTEQYGFSRTISYHSHGSVIYWYFGQDGALYDDTLQFAQAISATTGYTLDADYENLDPAGYKDWALQTCGIPSLTIEIGRGSSPVSADQYATIWEENQHVWETLLSRP